MVNFIHNQELWVHALRLDVFHKDRIIIGVGSVNNRNKYNDLIEFSDHWG